MQKISRSKLELFLDCPRCFWLDVKKGVKRPPPAPYTINSAIDQLLKDEFDVYRREGKPHPLFAQYKLDLVPYQCKELNAWRHNFTGVQARYEPADFLVFGAVDDIWVNPQGELFVVDYKATGAKEYNIYDSYKRQMEVYQWLLRQNKYTVSETGYFLFAKVDKTAGFPGAKLSFGLFLQPQQGDTSWIEPALDNAGRILQSDIPGPGQDCPYCQFAQGHRSNEDAKERCA